MEISNYLVFFKKRNLFYKLILWKFRVYLNFAYFCEKIAILCCYTFLVQEFTLEKIRQLLLTCVNWIFSVIR